MKDRVLTGSISCVSLAIALLLPAGASGASGEIMRAEASADWSIGSIEGVVYRMVECAEFPQPLREPEETGGPPYPAPPNPPPEYFSRCAWIPYATVGPASADGCASSDRDWSSLGEGVQMIWSEDERTGVGSAHFDIKNVPLEYGGEAPLLCLSLVEAAPRTIACALAYPSLCPPYVIVARSYPLDSATLEAESAIVETTPPTSVQPKDHQQPIHGLRQHPRAPCHRRRRHGTSQHAGLQRHAYGDRHACMRHRAHHHRRSG